MAPSVSYCIVCNDDDEDVVYKCKGNGGACTYQLCAGCVKASFNDMSGAHSSFCALCKHPSALDMISAVCGRGAINAVEEKFRNKVEFQVKELLMKREASRTKATDMSEQARKIFNQLSERLNLKCPRCKTVFDEYDGCNALTCAVASCRAAFCAICLKDCGEDAHPHVLQNHGSYFDKAGFDASKSLRAKSEIDKLMASLSHEPLELQQLVSNQIDKAKLLVDISNSADASFKTDEFLQKAKDNLTLAMKADRLALLSNPEEYTARTPISRDAISPRCSVPSEYRLSLTRLEEHLYRIRLEHEGIVIDDVDDHFNDHRKVESLVNLSQSLQCAVLAFEGATGLYQSSRPAGIPKGNRVDDNEVCISMKKINRDGNGTEEELPNYVGHNLIVIGLNPNKRMLLLERYVEQTPNNVIMFEPLQHLLGIGAPRAVFTELDGIPESGSQLNVNQRKVANPLELKTAMEVAGPPGTGKTKTIIELVRALLSCTSSDIIVLSERNGAINAIAEKFKKESMKRKGGKFDIIDLEVWQSVMAYGNAESMGESTKLFTVDNKIKFHPELTDLQEKQEMLIASSKNLSQALRGELSNIVESFGSQFDEEFYATIRSREIKRDTVEFSSPLSIIDAVDKATSDIKSLLEETSNGSDNNSNEGDAIGGIFSSAGSLFFRNRFDVKPLIKEKSKVVKYPSEEGMTDLVVRHSFLLSRLIPIRTDKEREDKTSQPWDAKEATKRLNYISEKLSRVLDLQIFNADNATHMYKEKASVDEAIVSLRKRLTSELPACARLHMSTIGSSHRLVPKDENDHNVCDEDDDDVANIFGRLTLRDNNPSIHKDTICIFDESGCIPAYELLGLSRLGRSINALILVGDKHQLPPYDPNQGMTYNRDKKFAGYELRDRNKILSLLDSSALTTDTGKIMLDTQYRVPRDIAEMLNMRVYKGQYKTCPTAKVPTSGLSMINVPWAESPRRKYVNPNEIEMGMNLLRQLMRDYEISSTLIITPYKNQQREFEFQIKRNNERGFDEIETTVLTIDQCQGQEADAVILSLVRRPTRFLTKNRLNVALSRVCKKLYVLTDFKDFRAASSDNNWECAGLASDMLADFM